jgi:pimeloyl-ACP methyl ester carboxylesterase
MKIFLIHGWGGTKESLRELGGMLKKNLPAEVEYIELPGFGETQLPREFKLEDYCEYVEEAVKASSGSESSKNILVGHSFGGKILLRLAAQGRVSAGDVVVLINSSGLHPKNSLKKRFFKFLTVLYSPVKFVLNRVGLSGLQRFLQKAFYKFIVRARDYEKLQGPVKKETFKNVIEEHISESELKQIKNKILIIWGKNDTVTPVWMGEKLGQLIPDSKLKIVPNATHGLPIKSPGRVSDIVVDFIK